MIIKLFYDWDVVCAPPNKVHDWSKLPKLEYRELVSSFKGEIRSRKRANNYVYGWREHCGRLVPLGESKKTKAPNFDFAEFLKSHPDLRGMELAIVMVINDFHKQKMLSKDNQTGLMYYPVRLSTYQTPASEGSFLYPGGVS